MVPWDDYIHCNHVEALILDTLVVVLHIQHVEVGTKALVVDDILRMVDTLTLVVRMVGTLTLVVGLVAVVDIQQTVVGVRVDIQQMVVGVRDGFQQSVVVARVGVQQPVVVVHVDYQNQTCYFGHAFCCSFDCDVSYDYDHKHVWLHTPPQCHYSHDTDENDASFLHENQLLFPLVLVTNKVVFFYLSFEEVQLASWDLHYQQLLPSLALDQQK